VLVEAEMLLVMRYAFIIANQYSSAYVRY